MANSQFSDKFVAVKTAQGVYVGRCKEYNDYDCSCSLNSWILITCPRVDKNDIKMSADYIAGLTLNDFNVSGENESLYLFTKISSDDQTLSGSDDRVYITYFNEICSLDLEHFAESLHAYTGHFQTSHTEYVNI